MNYEEIFFDYKKEPGKMLKKDLAFGDNIPLVSIVTSYYNSSKYINQTLNCVLNQTFPFWEWIIVNDGSTEDNTDEFLNSLAKLDNRIKIYKKENEGLAKGRDYAISKSTTNYILPLDADDLIIPTYIETAYWSLRTNEEASWVFSNSVGFGKYIYLYNPKFDSEKMKKENLLTATALIRKDKIQDVGGYGVAKRYVNEDWHLWLRMLAKGCFPVQMNFYGFWYRRCKTSLLSDINNDKKEENNMRLRDLKVEADKIQKTVFAKIYPNIQEQQGQKEESLNWEGKDFGKKLKQNKILYILPWLRTDEKIYEAISTLNLEKNDITIITTKPSQYIYRQKIEQYAEVFDLTTFIDNSYWHSFIEYIIQTRQIQTIYVANELEDINKYIKETFPNLEQKLYEYKDNDEILKKQEQKYKKSKRLHNRIIRKIKNIFSK